MNIQEIEKSFSIVVGKVLDFVDDKVSTASAYDKRVLRDSIYNVRDNLINNINATENKKDESEIYRNI